MGTSMLDHEYLARVTGEPLKQCLAELVSKQPHDPIEWIAHWLYRYQDNELYFYEKSIFLKELHRMKLELEKDNARRQKILDALRSEIQAVKQSVGVDVNAMAMVLRVMNAKKTYKRPGSDQGFSRGSRGFSIGSQGRQQDSIVLRETLRHEMAERLGVRYSQIDEDELREKMLQERREERARLKDKISRRKDREVEIPAHLIGQASWALDCNVGLILNHSILGQLRARLAIVLPETPDWWEKQEYVAESLYDHEIYSVCEWSQNEEGVVRAVNDYHDDFQDDSIIEAYGATGGDADAVDN